MERSRRALFEALVALVLERGWDRVTVHDVCERANVGRSTFYVHFGDKEDLLVSGLDNVRDMLRSRRVEDRGRPFGFLRGLIAHADESRRLFRAVIGKRSGPAVQRRFREIALDLVRDELVARRVDDANVEIGARYLAGALVEILIWWVDGRTSPPASEIEAAYVRLSEPVVRALRG